MSFRAMGVRIWTRVMNDDSTMAGKSWTFALLVMVNNFGYKYGRVEQSPNSAIQGSYFPGSISIEICIKIALEEDGCRKYLNLRQNYLYVQ